METKMRLTRPASLQVGGEYLLQARGVPFLEHVRFIAYDPCPAFVIVSSGANRRRCPRDDIFILSASSGYLPPLSPLILRPLAQSSPAASNGKGSLLYPRLPSAVY
jgi:hypothetical protein